jgi:DNA-binding IclR family transcriptional regulator
VRTGRGSLQRGIDILSVLASETGPLDASAIASRLALPKSSIYRILQVLRSCGLVNTAQDGRGFSLGFVLLQWAAALRRSLDLVQLASPLLRRLAQETGETATLTLLQGDRAVVANVTDASARLRVTSQAGTTLPLHAGASSKVILAFLPKNRWREVVGKGGLRALTAKTITDRQALWRECERIRAQGVAQSDEEVLQGARGVAAPIFDERGSVCGSLAVAAPRLRLRGESMRRARVLVKREAQVLSRSLGYPGVTDSLDFEHAADRAHDRSPPKVRRLRALRPRARLHLGTAHL